ncbi:unnamed protein product [Linum tenue]|uniref:Uncharacterized protein n=1 Tax=Linum tenue TaxID=586396 RepID=A0AAV0MDD3_9ROSI|nr:unnamed protein product [Linum tenue]
MPTLHLSTTQDPLTQSTLSGTLCALTHSLSPQRC